MTEQELLEKGYRKYRGTHLDVYFNLAMCAHSGNCVRGNRKVFNTERKPWIEVDAASSDEVQRVIDTCPSRALHYIKKEGR